MERDQKETPVKAVDRVVLEHSYLGVYTQRQDADKDNPLHELYHGEVKAVEDKIRDFSSKE